MIGKSLSRFLVGGKIKMCHTLAQSRAVSLFGGLSIFIEFSGESDWWSNRQAGHLPS